jgi:hypothetical protein
VDPDALEKCAGDAASGLKKPELAGSDDLSSVASKRASAQSEVEVPVTNFCESSTSL